MHFDVIFYSITPFHIACYCGHPLVADFLLSSGADKMALGENDISALHCAAEEEELQSVKFLIEKGLRVDMTTENGQVAGYQKLPFTLPPIP